MSSESNKDLVWDLGGFSQRSLAADFVKRFENKLCVYSGSVEQLYTNYTIFFPEEENRNMVILPDPYAYHDTFQGVPPEAIKVTGLNIIPGELINRPGLYITVPIKQNGRREHKPVPLQKGLEVISKRRSEENPFLPVLIKGDLREVKNRLPVLHLHCIQLDMLVQRSAMERQGIKRVITEKLPKIT